jgi:HAD superfamily hydrolase (TIGR01509 family)
VTAGGAADAGKARFPLERLDAVLFDLDGVLTDTASLHQQAWAAVFTDLFGRAGEASGRMPAPFTGQDYRRLADGEPRLDGVRNVLADRGIALPEGSPADPPGLESAQAVAAAKDVRFAALLGAGGPRPFPGSARVLHSLRAVGVATAVVSASRHCTDVLAAAGLDDLFDARVDGQAAVAMALPGKPDPATYLEAAARLGADPGRTAVVEDAIAGVAAGRRGGFGLVIGVGRRDDPGALRAAGADLVIGDLGDLAVVGTGPLADGWHLTYRPASEAGEGMRETLCTLGNGYLATRGARSEAADDRTHYPGTYIAGVYNRLRTDLEGRPVEHESIVNAPSWLPLTFSVCGGPWLGEPGATISGEELRLDLRAGVLLRRFQVTDPAGRRTCVTERRLVSMADPHLAATALELVAENWAGPLRVRSGIDGTCCADQTTEARLLSHCHLVIAGSGDDPPDVVWLAARTTQSGVVIAEAARTRVTGAASPPRLHARGRHIGHEHGVELAEGARCHAEKVAAVYTSKDAAISEPAAAAREAAAAAPGFGELLAAHRAAWARLWSRATLTVDAAGRPAGVVNLHLFHLLQVASPHAAELDAGLAARGLHGEGYEGHVFWDELFVFPALNFRLPAVSRALLRYRHRRLPAARRLAAGAGEAGARFPWQSGSDGREETPVMLFNPRSRRWVPDRSSHQRHVGLAVAYNCWQYWQATGDDEFLADTGAELIFEIARHFAYLAAFDQALGRWRIRGVMGPDEFHDGYPWTEAPGVDDNAYTNVLTSWVLTRALELAARFSRGPLADTLARLGVGDAELARFEEVSSGLYVPFHDGVISQFAGYERLDPIDLVAYRARYGNIGRLDLILEAQGDTVRRYQVAKQADTLMLFYLFPPAELRETFARLGYQLTDAAIRRTAGYYSARVTHGSTLSRVVHAWVAARSDRRASWRHFTEALAADMADTQGGTTSEGIHLGAMAGTIDLLQRCYTGLHVSDSTLAFDPALPGELASLRLAVAYRAHRLDVRIGHDEITVTSAPGDALPVTLNLAGQRITLRPGGRARRRLPARPGAVTARQGTSTRPPAARRPWPGEGPIAPAADPVCGMVVEESAASSITRQRQRYFFCSRACRELFRANPEQYMPGGSLAPAASTATVPRQGCCAT